MKMDAEKKQWMAWAGMLFGLAAYVSGLVCQALADAGHVSMNPFRCFFISLFSLQGWKMTCLVLLLFAAFAFMIIFQGSTDTLAGKDEERDGTVDGP